MYVYLLGTTSRTQVGRRVSNGALQERQNHVQILPNPHTHVQVNLALTSEIGMIT